MGSTLRYSLYALGVVAVLALAFWFLWNFDPFDRRQKAETKAATATVAAEVAKGQTEIIERRNTDVIVIRDQTEREANAVQQLPDAKTPIAPARRASLCGALSRMRGNVDVCTAGVVSDATGSVR